MKKHGAVSEFKQQRDRAIYDAYRLILRSTGPNVPLAAIFEQVVLQPCPRFWVSPERALIIVYQMLHNQPMPTMRPCKQLMFREIFSRVLELKRRFLTMSYRDCVEKVVFSQAPQFYISPSAAMTYFFNYRKLHRRTVLVNAKKLLDNGKGN